VNREKQLKGWSHAKKQLLIDGKLGINLCTELVEVSLYGLNSRVYPEETEGNPHGVTILEVAKRDGAALQREIKNRRQATFL
jgi:hypothetical protein